MSIEEKYIAASSASAPPDVSEEAQRAAWYRGVLSPLWLCLLIALALRAWLIVHTHGMIDGDEALVGIQAERILQGNFPIYFYGIPYFGSLEAYLAAPLIAIIGPSPWALRIEATLVSLLLVALTWRFASLLADAARLPAFAKTSFAFIAGLAAAIPPLYDGIVELRAWGGYIETYVLMLLLLISAFQVTRRWRADASRREMLLRWAGIGLLVGVGMWVYPLIITAIFTAALWIGIDLAHAFLLTWRASSSHAGRFSAALSRALKPLRYLWAAFPAALLGASPVIGWGATHDWQNIRYLQQLGGSWSLQRVHIVHRVINQYLGCVAPRVISGSQPVESKLSQALHAPLLSFNLGVIFLAATVVLLSVAWNGLHRAGQAHAPTMRHLAGLPVLFAASAAAIYCLSSASAYSLISCGLDLTGRYATPLMLAYPFLLAALLTGFLLFVHDRRGRSAARVSTTTRDRADEEASARSRSGAAPSTILAMIAIFALLFAYLGTQTWTYVVSDPNLDFQSPYCSITPADYAPIITYMQQHDIRYAWATNLLGHQITFETSSQILVVDPLETTRPPLAINRIPSYTDAVFHADRPSLLVFVQHNDPRPLLLRLLDADHVTYTTARFPSEPGIDVLVVTPLNQTVYPHTAPYLKAFSCFTT